jgi:hypothetical protein
MAAWSLLHARHVRTSLGHRLHDLPAMWTARSAGRGQHLGGRSVQLPMVRARMVGSHSQRSARHAARRRCQHVPAATEREGMTPGARRGLRRNGPISWPTRVRSSTGTASFHRSVRSCSASTSSKRQDSFPFLRSTAHGPCAFAYAVPPPPRAPRPSQTRLP